MKWIKLGKFRIFVLFLAALLLGGIIFNIYSYRKNHNSAYDFQLSATAPDSYWELFNAKAKKKLILRKCHEGKGRYPIAEFISDKRYFFIVNEINEKVQPILSNSIAMKFKDINRSGHVVYNSFVTGNFEFEFAGDSIEEAKKLFFTLSGDSIQMYNLQDSAIIYRCILNKFSIQVGEEGFADIILERSSLFAKKTSSELAFVKKGSKIFFIFSSTDYEQDWLPKDIIKDVIL
jgi:hypothetical protein